MGPDVPEGNGALEGNGVTTNTPPVPQALEVPFLVRVPPHTFSTSGSIHAFDKRDLSNLAWLLHFVVFFSLMSFPMFEEAIAGMNGLGDLTRIVGSCIRYFTSMG